MYLNGFEQEINSTNMKNFCFITQALLQEVNPLMMRVVSIVPNNLPTDDTDICTYTTGGSISLPQYVE